MALTRAAERLGNRGEDFVANYLIDRGVRILDRNWRIKEGELDIVGLDIHDQILIVEVKTRSSAAYGDPLEAITTDKAYRIQRLALAWLALNKRLGNSYRIDVAGVLISRSGGVSIDYREGIL